jgi:hypothetical protein
MTSDEFVDAMNSGAPFEVRIRGYVTGMTAKSGRVTDRRSHSGDVVMARGDVSICAEVRIDSAEVRNFDTSWAGTNISLEQHGGGTLRIPIELLEVAPVA